MCKSCLFTQCSRCYPRHVARWLSVKIISKQSIIGRERSFIWTKLRTIARVTAPQTTLRHCSGSSVVLGTLLCLVRNENIKVRDAFLQVFKRKTGPGHAQWVWVGEALVPRKGLLHRRRTSAGWLGRKAVHLSLLTWAFFTSGHCALFFNN